MTHQVKITHRRLPAITQMPVASTHSPARPGTTNHRHRKCKPERTPLFKRLSSKPLSTKTTMSNTLFLYLELQQPKNTPFWPLTSGVKHLLLQETASLAMISGTKLRLLSMSKLTYRKIHALDGKKKCSLLKERPLREYIHRINKYSSKFAVLMQKLKRRFLQSTRNEQKWWNSIKSTPAALLQTCMHASKLINAALH